MTRHFIDYYMDGFKVIAFCKLCSVEGDELLKPCQGNPKALIPIDITQKDLDNERDWLDSQSESY